MSDLTEFLRARFDEEAEVAHRVRSRWYVDDDGRLAEPDGEWADGSDHLPNHHNTWALALDPERMLADVEAKRRIVALHDQWPTLVETEPEVTTTDDSLGSIALQMSRRIAWLTTKEYVARFGTEAPMTPMLLAMASVYADHEEYQEEWSM